MSDGRKPHRLRPVIRVFISSTFSDMKHERNALETDAFPKLEQLCQRHGFQFQAIDLRWGLSTEAGLDHRTMRICFDELRRAQEISPRPNFLILLGNRYGWRPLPEEISAEEFHALEHAATQIPGSADTSAVAVLREWYREDTNAVPPVYLLQSRRQRLGDDQDYTHDAIWNQVQAVLWTIINRAMPPEQLQRRFDGAASEGSLPAIVRFQASATEQEIWHGALRVPDAREYVLAFFREIENLAAFSNPKQIKDFVDVDPSGSVAVALQTEQDRLKAELRQRLGSANVFRNETPARLVDPQDNQGGRTVDVTTDHLGQLCANVVSRLSEIIQGQIEEYWRNTAQASTDRAARELEIEQREYERFATERGGEESFVGRQVELQAILDYVGSDSRWPLVIHGASGCGKTALLARASLDLSNSALRIPHSAIVTRFIGVAPRSSDLRSLLSSLCQELRQRNPRAAPLPTEIKELRDEFFVHLQAAPPEQPLILFLDALDQLADADNGWLLNWLPPGSLPDHVKLVVSCLSDGATGDPAGQPYAELKRRQIPAGNFINLDVLSEAEARLLLFDRWLPKVGRKVSDDQRARIEQRLASPACRQPIFLKLLFEEVQLWHSYDPAPVPGESVPALLGQLFDRLSQPTNHGPLLVNRVLGYLSASRHGLAENEILEILFADPEYRAKLNEATEQTRHELPPNAKRIPIALWSRLRFDLAPYLTERAAPGANVLTFYHRQVAEWVQEHFGKSSGQSWQPHQRLANYFRNLADPEKNQTWQGESPRPFLQLVFHLLGAERVDECCQTLCDLRFVEARCRFGQVFELIADYRPALEQLPEAQAELAEERLRQERVAKWTREIIEYARQSSDRRDRLAHREAVASPEPVFPEIIPSEEPQSEKQIETERKRIIENPTRLERLRLFYQFIRSRCHSLVAFGSMPGLVVQMAYNSAISGAVVTAADRIVEKDASIPLLLSVPALRHPLNPFPTALSTLAGHKEKVSDVAQTSDGRHAISAGDDCTLRLWDLQSGQCLKVLLGHRQRITSVALSADGCRALSAGSDGELMVWDLPAGKCTFILKGHGSGLLTVAITPDGALGVSGGHDKTICVWDLGKGICIGELVNRDHFIQGVKVSADGSRVFSVGGNEAFLRDHNPVEFCVWDLKTKECIERFSGPMSGYTSISVTPDARMAVMGSKVKVLGTEFTQNTIIMGGRRRPQVFESISLWNATRGQPPSKTVGRHGTVNRVDITPDGKIAVLGCDSGTISVIATVTGEEMVSLKGHDQPIKGIAIAADGSSLVSASDDSTLKTWNLKGMNLPTTKGSRPISPDAVHITLDSKKVIAMKQRQSVMVWMDSVDRWAGASSRDDNFFTVDFETGECRSMFQEFISLGLVSVITPGNDLIIFTNEAETEVDRQFQHSVFVFSLKDGKCVKWLPLEKLGHVQKASVSLDGRLVAAWRGTWVVKEEGGMTFFGGEKGGSSSLDILDLETGDCLRTTFQGKMVDVGSVQLSPDGKVWFSRKNHDNAIRAWDTATGRELFTMQGPEETIFCMQLTPDGRRILTGGTDNTLKVWDVRSGKCERVLAGHSGPVMACVITPDCGLAISVSKDRTVRMWNIQEGVCVTMFCGEEEVTTVSEVKANGAFACSIRGQEVILFSPRNLNMGIPVVTASKRWVFGEGNIRGRWLDGLSVVCEWCGQSFSPPTKILRTITAMSEKVLMREHESPCLALPDEAWRNPELISSCPHCDGKLRFNPFVNDNSSLFVGSEVEGKTSTPSTPLAEEKAVSPHCVRTDTPRTNPNAELEKRMKNYFKH
jgi:WD40 repeat protein